MKTAHKILLIGPMGAGKTSLGRRLAKQLNWSFYDTDHVVIERTGVDISRIFEHEGEGGFRKREYQALDSVLQLPENAVIACGGGIVMYPDSRRLIMAQTLVVFLDVSVECQLRRLGRLDNRPLLQVPDPKAQLKRLREERLGIYEGVADVRISTDENYFPRSFECLMECVKTRIEL